MILVTSAGPSEGKTTTVANLAAVFAEAEYSVLVINCDFRRPRLHRYLGGSDEARKVVQSDVPGVRMVNNVLSSTHPNPAEVTAAQRRVIEAARGIFDVILLDTAPLLSTNDASELIGVADLVVLVARAGKTTRPNAQRATEVLHRLEATVAGVAMLGARYIPSAQYYYYATEEGRDPSRPEAASHPLDLLVRADDLSHAQPTDRPAPAPAPVDDGERLEVELQGSGGASIDQGRMTEPQAGPTTSGYRVPLARTRVPRMAAKPTEPALGLAAPRDPDRVPGAHHDGPRPVDRRQAHRLGPARRADPDWPPRMGALNRRAKRGDRRSTCAACCSPPSASASSCR